MLLLFCALAIIVSIQTLFAIVAYSRELTISIYSCMLVVMACNRMVPIMMCNCANLKGNSSCGSCDENHVISGHMR
jgi:hypothetical protein